MKSIRTYTLRNKLTGKIFKTKYPLSAYFGASNRTSDGKPIYERVKTAKKNPRRKTSRSKPGTRVTAPRKTYRSAKRHTRKATTKRTSLEWMHVYESARKEGFREGEAIKIANGVLKRRAVRVRKNPLKRAAKRSISFGRCSDPHVIAAIRRGPGKRIKHFYFTGDRFTDRRDEAHIYATKAKALAQAKALLDRLPESIVSLKVSKP